MSTLEMITGEARTLLFSVTLTSGTPSVTAAFVDVDPRDIDAMAEVTPATGLSKYDLSGRLYRQGTPSTTLTAYDVTGFGETDDYKRKDGKVLLPVEAPTSKGVYVLELTGTNGAGDVWKDRSTLLVVS